MTTKNESGDQTVEAPPPEETDSGFKALERDVDPEVTVTKLAAESKPAVTDDDATVVKPGKPAIAVAPAKASDDDEATRLVPKSAPVNVKSAPAAVRAPAAAPVMSVGPAKVALPSRRGLTIWLVIALVVAVGVFLVARMSSGPRPEDLKPMRSGQPDDKAEKRSTFKSLFDW